ncbi:hypothetical protein FRB91_005143 [Serendipita sp. 411]|nr:hypothetical protein FRB91_005143 [Serendipita sp. 411]KAG9049583.1 hypothetical protein FS842_011512 [Serendipita sp. 407]
MKWNVKNRFSGLFQKHEVVTPTLEETTRAPSMTIQDTFDECLISRLPREVLLQVFGYLGQEKRSPRCTNITRNHDLYHVSLVCRTWNNLAAHIYYHTIQFYSVSGVLRFHQMLQDSPHICKIVKNLTFPARLGRTCPNELLDAFEGITNRVEGLSELNITLRLVEKEPSTSLYGVERLHVIPIEEGRHSDLKVLSVYANGPTPAKFPVTLTTSFKRLTCLSLKGVFLSEPVSTDVIPILPELSSFTTVTGNGVLMMDDWLLACPKLRDCLITGRQPVAFSPSTDDAPMKLLVHGNIGYWCLSGSGHTHIGKWLASCNSITYLLIDWPLFSNSTPDIYPSSLRQLAVEIDTTDQVKLDAFEKHFGTSPVSNKLRVFFWGRNALPERDEEALRALCTKSGVSLSLRDRSGYLGEKKQTTVSNIKQVIKGGSSKHLRSWETAKT